MAELITSPSLVAHKLKELEERIDKLEQELQSKKAKNGKKTKNND
tara:strand:- start:2159 stop:2293 length:135 start_codon:yes stop_codon:yes gene_type:complete